jgi:AcrR family transcriptional regulator
MNRKRVYTLKRRAENQADTRRRIVEATVDLHSELGPARTSVSAIAERAGVQRHTVYAHFPTERNLALACSGLALERDPLPDVKAWRTVDDPELRIRRGLTEVYAWYGRNSALAACVLRDAEVHALTREMAQLRIGARMEEFQRALASGFRPSRTLQAALTLALAFNTWRSLVEDSKLSASAAVDLVASAVVCAAARR